MSQASRTQASDQSAAVRWVYRIVMLGGLALLWRLNAPGHMSVDSVLALHEGRFHARETWNPAIFGWLLGQADAVVPGQALDMGVSIAVLFAAWAGLAGLRARASWLAVGLALLITALPVILGVQFLLQAMNFDVLNVPSRPIHPYLNVLRTLETEE